MDWFSHVLVVLVHQDKGNFLDLDHSGTQPAGNNGSLVVEGHILLCVVSGGLRFPVAQQPVEDLVSKENDPVWIVDGEEQRSSGWSDAFKLAQDSKSPWNIRFISI